MMVILKGLLGNYTFQRRHFVRILAAVFFVVTCAPRVVEAQEVFPFGACGSAPDLISIVNSLHINTEDMGNLKKLVGSVNTINVSGNELHVVRDGEQVASLAKAASDREKVCHFMRGGAVKSVNLEKGGGDIPGENLAALAAVLAYRAAHPWPFLIPDLESPSTKIEVRTLKWAFEEHTYYFVAIVGAPKPLTLGCGAEEYYRVSPENFEVLPYQGCPDNSSTVLPRLQQLPP